MEVECVVECLDEDFVEVGVGLLRRQINQLFQRVLVCVWHHTLVLLLLVHLDKLFVEAAASDQHIRLLYVPFKPIDGLSRVYRQERIVPLIVRGKVLDLAIAQSMHPLNLALQGVESLCHRLLIQASNVAVSSPLVFVQCLVETCEALAVVF